MNQASTFLEPRHNRPNPTISLLSLLVPLLVLPLVVAADSQQHPDFSGLWMPSRATEGFPRELPYTEWAQQKRDEFAAEFDIYLDAPARFCVHPGMPNSVLFRAPFPLEVIQREHDITLFWEGYYQYRKIHIEGYPRPEPVLNSRMGFSVGKWEGDTLVVKTTYLKERVEADILSDQAEITERIKLEQDQDGNKVLAFYLELNDPKTYTEKLTAVGRWNWSPDTPIMEYVCSETIYEEHLERVRATKDGTE